MKFVHNTSIKKEHILFYFQQNRSNTVEPNDIWTVVRVEGNFHLVTSSDSDFEVLDPILKEDTKNHVEEDVRTNFSYL